MSIYKRTIILICGTLLVLMLLVYVISNVIYRQGFEDLERKTVENNVTQVTEALSVNLDALNALCYDWAEWDDTYKFAQEYNQEYVDRNLQDDTFSIAKISLVSIVNNSQDMVYSKAYDLINEEEIILRDDFINTVITEGLATPTTAGNTVAGVTLFTGQPMLVVSQPIMPSLGEGPIAGALIFGRIIDAEVISHLAKTTNLSVNLLPIPTDGADLETNRIIESLNESGPTLVQAQNSDTIAGYTYVNDLSGNPVFIFEVDIPRDIFHQGTKAIAILHSLLAFIGIVFCIVFILLIKKLMLSRLINLSNSVSEIGSSTDVSRRVTISGNDELTRLGTNINEMLTSLENADKAARESEELLRENNEQLDTVLNSVPCGILVIDAETHIIEDANIYASNIIGVPAEEIIGKECHQFVCPAERGKCPITDLGKDVDHSERILVNINGDSIPILKNIARITIGKNQYLLETFIDITERKRMEAALADEATRRRILVEQSRDGIVILYQNGAVYETNRQFAEMLGYSPKEVLKLNVWDWEFLYPPEQVREMLRTVDEAGDHFITQHKRKDGTTYDVEISTNGAMFAGQKLIFCVCRDISERTRMEKALKESEEKFSLAFRASPNTMAITTINEGRFIEINDSHTRLTGYTREEAIGHTALELGLWTKSKDRARMLDILKKQGRVDNEEFTFRMKSGEIRDWLFSAEPITIGGEPCLISITTDITAQKRMEQALRESEEKFSLAFRASPAIVAIATLADGKFIEVNDSYIKATGYSRKELIGKKSNDIGIWANPEDRTKILKTVKEQGRINNEEFDIRIKSGEIRTWLFSAESIDIAGETCLIGVSVDITESKRAVEVIREREKRFSDIADSAMEWIWEVDAKGKYIYSSPVVEKILGYNHEEIMKKHFYDLFLPEEREELKKAAFAAFAQKQPIKDLINKNRCKNGKTVELLTSGVPVIDEAGNLLGYRGVDTDVTERRRAEQALKESMANLEQSSNQLAATNKELEAFSYSVSHDLRAPLRSIDGFSQALLEDYEKKLDKTGQDYLRRLRTASQKMGELIDGILKLSRLTRSEMHHVPIDLSTLAEEITNRFQEMQPERRVKFAIAKDLTTNGDPQLLRVLLENLLGNAWKFTSKNPRAKIEFSMNRNNGKKAFFVRDNGVGFDMTYADRLFSAFQRLHEATEFPGTGIGLATVQRIINRHGGTIWAEGAVGKGATFHFTLD